MRIFAIAFCFSIVLMTVLTSGWVEATDWAVGTTLDSPDGTPGDGICVGLSQPCSLRGAIEESNALGGSHTIILPAGAYYLTHTVGTTVAELTVTADVEVSGAAISTTAIDGGSATRIFSVSSGARLRLESMTVRNGVSEFNAGGCVSNDGTLEMESVTISSCISPSGNGGGAIRNNGTFTGTWVTILGNYAVSAAGTGAGGGLSNTSTGIASLFDSEFIYNTASSTGGGIFNTGALTLENVTVRDGEATNFDGGGIYNGGIANLTRVTVSGNLAGTDGGGVSNRNSGELTMVNATVSGNSAGTTGGGIYVSGTDSSVSLNHVTIAGNSDSGAAAAIGQTSGASLVELVNTVITSGGATNCSFVFPFNSLGHNLEDLDTCGLYSTGDQVNTTPFLGPLQDNGGWTHTMALLAGSPGIDEGDGTLGIVTDQREWIRPADGDGDGDAEVDIGAYELEEVLFADGFETGSTDAWSDVVP